MTATAGQVAVKLNLDKKQFEAGMQSARKSIDLLSTAMSSIAALGVGATLLNIGKSALKASSDFEQANIAFEVMLGSADKASKLVNELQNMANVTPFETQDLLDASRVLLNFGTELEEILPDLRMLGDISGGNRAKMQSMTLAFAQMSSAGRLMGQDLLQMVNAGFNPLQQISEKTGKSIAELKDEMAEGRISVDMVKEAFRDATSEGGRFYGMMDKQSQSLEGTLSTLNDAYTLMTRSISDLALPAIKEQVVEITKVVEKITENIEAMKEWAAVNQSTVFGIKNAAVAIGAFAAGFIILKNGIVPAIVALKSYNATMQAYYASMMGGKVVGLTFAKIVGLDIVKAVQAATIAVRALTASLLANPITWVTVALGAGAAAWWGYQQAIHATTNAIKELNAEQDQNVHKTTEAIRAIVELRGAKKLDYDNTRKLCDAVDYLTSKYPKYVNHLMAELNAKKAISQATAEQIANELTLAKVKDLTERKQKIDKRVAERVSAYNLSQIVNSARFGTEIRKNPGRLGASKALQRDQDAVNAELEKVKKEREGIINELTALNMELQASSSSKSSSGSGGKSKTAKQLAAEEKARQKEALDLKIAQLEIEKYETQKNADEIYKINLKQAEARIAAAKAGTSEYAQALAEKLQLERDYENKQKALKAQQLVDDLTFKKQELDNELANIQMAYDAHKISKTKMLETEITYINKKKQLEAAALAEQLKLVEGNAAEEVKIKQAAARTIEEYNIQANRKAIELSNYQKEAFTGIFDDISSGWGSTVTDLLNGQITFNDAINSLFDTVLNSFGNMCGELVQKWLHDHMTMESITQAFTAVKIWCDNLLGISTKKRIAENTALVTSEVATASATAASATTTASSMTGLASAVNLVSSPIMKLAGAMATLAVSSGAVALSMPIIAVSTAVTAASAALAAFSVGMLNTGLMLSTTMASMFAPATAMLASEMAVVTAAAKTAAVAVGQLAVALAASSAASIPYVGWVLAPGAATSTGAAIAAGQMIAAAGVQFREKGGDVRKGQPYIVGEKRPELFIPDRNGKILPDTSALNGGGSATTYSTNVSMIVSATDAKSFEGRIDDLTDRIHANLAKKIRRRQLAALS